MTDANLPLIVEPDILARQLDRDDLLIVDLRDREAYDAGHLPGAVHCDFQSILRHEDPVKGLLPDDATLSDVFSGLGIDAGSLVVAYDDEGGGKASRLLWTLDVVGHPRFALLNGGMRAWAAEGLPLDEHPATPPRTDYAVSAGARHVATREELLRHVRDPSYALIDARSPAEYRGEDVRAARGGHIPGAVNIEWTDFMDPNRNLRVRDEATLRDRLEYLYITPARHVVVYCQTHHRSALTYIVLKSLGYQDVKGYPGAWSDWGNAPDTPVATRE